MFSKCLSGFPLGAPVSLFIHILTYSTYCVIVCGNKEFLAFFFPLLTVYSRDSSSRSQAILYLPTYQKCDTLACNKTCEDPALTPRLTQLKFLTLPHWDIASTQSSHPLIYLSCSADWEHHQSSFHQCHQILLGAICFSQLQQGLMGRGEIHTKGLPHQLSLLIYSLLLILIHYLASPQSDKRVYACMYLYYYF